MKFKFERYAVFLPMFLVSIVVPISSIAELIDTGTIDWLAESANRRSTPKWLIYLGGWLCFVFLSFWAFAPAIKYLTRGYIFAIENDRILIDDKWIRVEQIQSINEGWRGTEVRTTLGNFVIHPRMSRDGFDALSEFYGVKFDK